MPKRIWDENYKQYRVYSREEGCWILDDGTRLRTANTPAHVARTLTTAGPSNAPPRTTPVTPSTPGAQQPLAQGQRIDVSGLGEELGGLSIRTDATPRINYPTHGQPASQPYVPTGSYPAGQSAGTPQGPLLQILRAGQDVDPQNITDPILIQQGAQSHSRVKGIGGPQDRLDPRYTPRRPGFFKRGKVFKILWPEPAGNENPNITFISHGSEKFAAKIRWFVVVREGAGYCSCLPVQTYGGRGVAKDFLVKAHHAIIYSSQNPPDPLKEEKPAKGEVGMKMPIKVRLKSRSDRIDPMSRIHFLKIYTIEHNVKVYEVGDVHENSVRRFMKNFQECWNFSDESEEWAKYAEEKRAQEEKEKRAREAKQIAARIEEEAEAENEEDEEDEEEPPPVDPHEESSKVMEIRSSWITAWRASNDPVQHQNANELANMDYEDLRGKLYTDGAMPPDWTRAWARYYDRERAKAKGKKKR